MIEFAQHPAEFGLGGFQAVNAPGRQPVQDAEFLFTEPFIEADFVTRASAPSVAKQLRGLERAKIGGRQQYVRALILCPARKPMTQRARLITAKVAQGNIGVPY